MKGEHDLARTLRVVDRTDDHVEGKRPPTPPRCETEGCSRPGRNGKPRCNQHVEQMPYVVELLGALADREQQDADVLRLGAKAVDTESVTAKDILGYLRFTGDASPQRIARELALSAPLVAVYVRGLKRAGLLWTYESRRGGPVATITPIKRRRSRRAGSGAGRRSSAPSRPSR